jgi:hypothetical protein
MNKYEKIISQLEDIFEQIIHEKFTDLFLDYSQYQYDNLYNLLDEHYREPIELLELSKVKINTADFKEIFLTLGIFTNEEDFEEFAQTIDIGQEFSKFLKKRAHQEAIDIVPRMLPVDGFLSFSINDPNFGKSIIHILTRNYIASFISHMDEDILKCCTDVEWQIEDNTIINLTEIESHYQQKILHSLDNIQEEGDTSSPLSIFIGAPVYNKKYERRVKGFLALLGLPYDTIPPIFFLDYMRANLNDQDLLAFIEDAYLRTNNFEFTALLTFNHILRKAYDIIPSPFSKEEFVNHLLFDPLLYDLNYGRYITSIIEGDMPFTAIMNKIEENMRTQYRESVFYVNMQPWKIPFYKIQIQEQVEESSEDIVL